MEARHTIIVLVEGVRVYSTSVTRKMCLYLANLLFPGCKIVDDDVRYRS